MYSSRLQLTQPSVILVKILRLIKFLKKKMYSIFTYQTRDLFDNIIVTNKNKVL